MIRIWAKVATAFMLLRPEPLLNATAPDWISKSAVLQRSPKKMYAIP